MPGLSLLSKDALIGRYVACSRRLGEAEQQRDELLAALKALMDPCENANQSEEIARAAIRKAEAT